MAQLRGCKLPRALENPLDDLIMVAVEPLLQPLRDAGVTPNMVTLASAASSLASVYCCFSGRRLAAVGLWLLGYVLDCVDGFMARRFGMESVLGDLLDHGTDLLAYGGLLAFVAWRFASAGTGGLPVPPVWPLAVEAALGCLMVYHMQCQERGTEYMPVEGVDGSACADKAHLRWTRWVGAGTLTAWHLVLIWLFCVCPAAGSLRPSSPS